MGYPDPEQRRGWYVPPDDDEHPPLGEDARAQWCGLAPSALRGIRSLLREREARTWDLGDALLGLYGPPPAPGILDGSRVKLERLATVLGCSTSWLIALRLTSAAWPPRLRHGCGWSLHRDLRAWPGRAALLGDFLGDCDHDGVAPTVRGLAAWLENRRDAPTRGRPRLDPVARVERLALALDHDALVRLVARLNERLGLVAA